jgi:predicted ATPase
MLFGIEDARTEWFKRAVSRLTEMQSEDYLAGADARDIAGK